MRIKIVASRINSSPRRERSGEAAHNKFWNRVNASTKVTYVPIPAME